MKKSLIKQKILILKGRKNFDGAIYDESRNVEISETKQQETGSGQGAMKRIKSSYHAIKCP